MSNDGMVRTHKNRLTRVIEYVRQQYPNAQLEMVSVIQSPKWRVVGVPNCAEHDDPDEAWQDALRRCR